MKDINKCQRASTFIYYNNKKNLWKRAMSQAKVELKFKSIKGNMTDLWIGSGWKGFLHGARCGECQKTVVHAPVE